MSEKDREDGNIEFIIPQGFEEDDKPGRKNLNIKTSCTRCGTCCTSNSPVLLKDDLPLIISGVLSYDNLYTIREGELMKSHDNETYEASMDIIKIKGKKGTAECVFYDGEAGCKIYENRPAQCRIFNCWSSHEELTGLEEKRLLRKELFDSVEVLLNIMDLHEKKCSYRKLSDALEKVAQGSEDAAAEIIDMLGYDTYARPFFHEKFNIPENAMELILGRPMVDTIREFGVKVEKNGKEYILLPIEKQEGK
jgi:Fe-S-cluster containining protein